MSPGGHSCQKVILAMRGGGGGGGGSLLSCREAVAPIPRLQ